MEATESELTVQPLLDEVRRLADRLFVIVELIERMQEEPADGR